MPSPNTAHSFEPAPLTRRLAAFCYDLLLLAALIVWFPVSLLAIVAAFFCGFWLHGGQTVGMRTWCIRVVRDDGGGLDWRQAVARFAAALVSVLPIGMGVFWSVFDVDGRAWHDRWTRTRVVRTDVRGTPSARAPAPPSSRAAATRSAQKR